MNSKSSQYQKEEYTSRINRVIDYIDANISKELTLDNIARVANFSAFHFHRIFRALVKESLTKYIQRIRIEKAASLLIHNPAKSITEIAYDCGFSSSQFFARVFKAYFKISASEWRNKKSKIMHTNSKIVKDSTADSDYNKSESEKTDDALAELNVEVKDLPDMHVAYVRYIGPYKGDADLFSKLFTKIFNWAFTRDLIDYKNTKVIALYNDDPDITDENKLRVEACITFPENTAVDRDIGKLTIHGGKYAVAHFKIDKDGFESAWDALYGEWLPGSGYQPDDKPTFELFPNVLTEHSEDKIIVDICLPIIPL
ncbi:MAG: AraC family transcriptional regulator [Spirochaetes bacterium]|nr:AraC family transcriptional regulator [Spirochaetota bacterium]